VYYQLQNSFLNLSMEIYDNNNNNMEAQTDKIETHQKLQFLRGCYQNFG